MSSSQNETPLSYRLLAASINYTGSYQGKCQAEKKEIDHETDRKDLPSSCCEGCWPSQAKCEVYFFGAALALQFVGGLIILALMPDFRPSIGSFMLLGASIPCQIYFLWVFGTRCTCPMLFRCCVRRNDQMRCCIGYVSEAEGALLNDSERVLLHAMLQSPEQAYEHSKLKAGKDTKSNAGGASLNDSVRLPKSIAFRSAGMGRLLLSPGIVALGLVLGGPFAGLVAFIANQACMEAYTRIVAWYLIPDGMMRYGESECPEHFWISTYRSSSPVLVCFLLFLPLIAAIATLATRDCKGRGATSSSDADQIDHQAERSTSIRADDKTVDDITAASPWDLQFVAKRDPYLALARCIVIKTAIDLEKKTNKDSAFSDSIPECGCRPAGTSGGCVASLDCKGWKSLLCQFGWVVVAALVVMSYPTIARTAFLYSRTCEGKASQCIEAGPPVGKDKTWAYVYCTYCKIAIDTTPISWWTVREWFVCLVASLYVLYLQMSVTGYFDNRKMFPSRNAAIVDVLKALHHPAHMRALADCVAFLVETGTSTFSPTNTSPSVVSTGSSSNSVDSTGRETPPGSAKTTPSLNPPQDRIALADTYEASASGISIRRPLMEAIFASTSALAGEQGSSTSEIIKKAQRIYLNAREPGPAQDGERTASAGGAAAAALPSDSIRRDNATGNTASQSSAFIRSPAAAYLYSLVSLIAHEDLSNETHAITAMAVWTVLGLFASMAVMGLCVYFGLQAMGNFIIMQGEGSATTVILCFLVAVFLQSGRHGLGSSENLTTGLGYVVEQWASLHSHWLEHDKERTEAATGARAAMAEEGYEDRQELRPAEEEWKAAVQVAPLFKEPLPNSALDRAFSGHVCGFRFPMRAVHQLQSGAQVTGLLAFVVPLVLKVF